MSIDDKQAGLAAIIVIFIMAVLLWAVIRKNNSIEVIDGCEYIVKCSGYHTSLTHKGNCTNKVHNKHE